MEPSFGFVPYLVSLPRRGATPGGSRRSMLTKKQHELLLFIHQHLQKNGVSPSFDEMKDALALKSKSGIHRLITGLEERGFIRRLAHRARAVEVMRLPRSEEHTSELQSLMRHSYAVLCLKKNKT